MKKLKHRVEELENLFKMVAVSCKDINQTAINALENKEERLGLTDCKKANPQIPCQHIFYKI